MTALLAIVGACNKYVKALKKKFSGKRDDRRRQWRRRRGKVYAAAGTTPEDGLSLRRYGCYDNEAVDNMINEFIDNQQKARLPDILQQT